MTAPKFHSKQTTAKPKIRNVANTVFKLRQRLEELSKEEEPTLVERQFALGYCRIIGEPVFREVDSQGRLHVIYALCGHQIKNVQAYEIEGVRITAQAALNSEGVIVNGITLNNLVRLRAKLGTSTQTADSRLVSETSATSAYVGTSVAYVYARYIFNPDKFRSGQSTPSLVAIVLGKLQLDPRDGIRRFTTNTAVQLYDVLRDSPRFGGAGLMADELDTASWIAAANKGDELVTIPQFTVDIFGSNSSTNVMQFGPNVPLVPLLFGDVIRVSGSFPGALSGGVDYHVIVANPAVSDTSEAVIQVATTLQNARNITPILFGASTNNFKVTKVAETRFSSSIAYRGRLTRAVIEALLRACGGVLTYVNGKIGIFIEEYPVSTDTIINHDLISPVDTSTSLPSSDRATSLKATYTAANFLFRERETPPVGGAAFEALDNGIPSDRTINLNAVDKLTVARRLLKIEFAKRRQEFTTSFSTKLSKFGLNIGDVFNFDFDETDITPETTFQVTSKQLFFASSEGPPALGINFEARQLAEAAFDDDLDEEQIILSSVVPTVSDPRTVLPPGNPTVTEDVFRTLTGPGLRLKVTLAWEDSADPFIRGYRVRYRRSSDLIYTTLAETPDLFVEIFDLAIDTYDFEVVAVNQLGITSDPTLSSVLDRQIVGSTAPTSAVSNLQLQIGGINAVLTWDEHPDLDVLVGGRIDIYHHPDVAGGQEASSVFKLSVPGTALGGAVPLQRGTFYVRAKVPEKPAGPFTEISTLGVAPVQFIRVVDAGVLTNSGGGFQAGEGALDLPTIAEQPGFSGQTDPDTFNIDYDGINSVIRLASVGDVDAESDFDAITSLDALGQVASEGEYIFATGLAFTDRERFVLESRVVSTPIAVGDDFDDRPGTVDDFVSWDGDFDPASVNAIVMFRTTNDSPPFDGSTVWTAWQVLTSSVAFVRGVQFKLRLTSTDPAANIEVSELEIFVRDYTV